jgi:hypothetical protein
MLSILFCKPTVALSLFIRGALAVDRPIQIFPYQLSDQSNLLLFLFAKESKILILQSGKLSEARYSTNSFDIAEFLPEALNKLTFGLSR